MRSQGEGDGPWSVFPLLFHERRTVGFFKVRGVNVTHSELEDVMFAQAEILDFKAEVYNTESGLDALRLMIEARRGVSTDRLSRRIGEVVSKTFEVTPEIDFLELGTLGREFEASVKAARFVDRRG
jgi:phenylacetate-CoA ligase